MSNSVSIAEDQLVGIDPTANIVQAVVQNAIQIDPAGNTVAIQPGGTIGIDPAANAVAATVVNAMRIDPTENEVQATLTQPVVLALGQLIGIDPDANLVQTKPIPETFATLPTVTFTAGSTTADIAANANRRTLWLTADAANQAPVWIGGEVDKGIPLIPGERLPLPIDSLLTVAGTENDKLYVAETV